jgi:cation diffusion facilitator family transporter
MVSDAIHSLSDVLSTVIVMVGFVISSREADESHPYGHERFECVAAIILSVILFITGVGIGYAGIRRVVLGEYIPIPGRLALIVAFISILLNEWMVQFKKSAAKKINSAALMADALHHRSDTFSSLGALVGILAARMGFPVLDPIASVVIATFVIKAAYDIFLDGIDKIADKSCDEDIVNKMILITIEQEGVKSLDLIKTRQFASKAYVDIEIGVNKNLTVEEAHKIAEGLQNEIEKNFENVKHCMIHVNPSNIL